MEENYEILDDLDRWFESAYTPLPELTEEELQKIEEGADRWLIDTQGL